MEAECGRRLNLLNSMLVKQARMDKVWHGVIYQSVSVLYRFDNHLGGELVNLFRVDLEKADSNNLVKFPVAFTHVFKAGATSVSWGSVSDGETEHEPSTSKGSRTGKVSHHHGDVNSRVRL